MKFDDKELSTLVAKKIDKIVFMSNNQPILSVNINDLIQKKIESDENLKKQLLAQVLDSND